MNRVVHRVSAVVLAVVLLVGTGAAAGWLLISGERGTRMMEGKVHGEMMRDEDHEMPAPQPERQGDQQHHVMGHMGVAADRGVLGGYTGAIGFVMIVAFVLIVASLIVGFLRTGHQPPTPTRCPYCDRPAETDWERCTYCGRELS